MKEDQHCHLLGLESKVVKILVAVPGLLCEEEVKEVLLTQGYEMTSELGLGGLS